MSDFIAPVNTDAAYPARIGEPSVDGPIIYPPHQPGDPENVVPFQKETGLDPSKLPSLKDALGPKLKLLPGGASGPRPAVQPANNPRNLPFSQEIPSGQQVRLSLSPEAQAGAGAGQQPSKPGMSPMTVGLVAVAALGVGYLIAKSMKNAALNGPLVADMDDVESDDEE